MILVTSDLHLNDKKRDAYRFGIFDFLVDTAIQWQPWGILILGDLTDLKDNHSSYLVNKIVDRIEFMASYKPVYILMGNHDYYADPKNPFFKFIDKLESVTFITKPKLLSKNKTSCLFIPHTKNPKSWVSIKKKYKDKKLDYIFIHQTIDGVISESGKRLSGANIKPLAALKPSNGIWAGDIHKPQQIGPVTYIGSPYNIKFGEDFTPRVLLLDDSKLKVNKYHELQFNCPRKHSITIRESDELNYWYDKLSLKENDQVKIFIELTKEEVVDWVFHRNKTIEICEELKLKQFGIRLRIKQSKKRIKLSKDKHNKYLNDPYSTVEGFCIREKVPSKIKKYGKKLLESKDV